MKWLYVSSSCKTLAKKELHLVCARSCADVKEELGLAIIARHCKIWPIIIGIVVIVVILFLISTTCCCV